MKTASPSKMSRFLIPAVFGWIVAFGPAPAASQSPFPRDVQAPQAQKAPANLKALLAPRQSEMLPILQRYEADREALSRFYYLPSPTRFARLKRFDLDWSAALEKLDAAKLGRTARLDLRKLKAVISENIRTLGFDAAAAAEIAPLIPFAPDIQGLEEARLRMESMDAKRAAVILSGTIDRIRTAQAAFASAPPAVSKAGIEQAASAVEALGRALQAWHHFYNGYDPLFTWWMAQPYEEAEAVLKEYAVFLREKFAASAPADPQAGAKAAKDFEPAPAPPFNEVPDLDRLLRLPQDEMREIAKLLNPSRSGRSRGTGERGRPAAGAPSPAASAASATPAPPAAAQTAAPAPTKELWTSWLTALKKLDFDRLSRPAQITYLSLRHSLDGRIRRLEHPAAPGPRAKPDSSGISGRPIGREGLLQDLFDEMIPYTPEQLIDIGLREYAWCEAEMIKASEAMGFGREWKQAQEKVKDMHVPPGGQPDGIRDLLREAVAYLRTRDLITVPEIENETMRMEMMSPERQQVNPFFTGGALISVSYPTDTMTTKQKLESMRGNSLPISHATAFHEMIPGHNMQSYMSQRYSTFRSPIASSSFWGEGWCLYWEMLMYDLGFHDTPERKIGALFWRMHRCARIVFSLKYHLGEWSAQECIDYLVDKVNFERENAIGEVRRSFAGGYGPLYQAAYQLGALQLRQINRELVESGTMSLKAFNDAVIEMGSMPFPLVRLALNGTRLSPEMPLAWEFYGKTSPE